jgi:hypothetical protein
MHQFFDLKIFFLMICLFLWSCDSESSTSSLDANPSVQSKSWQTQQTFVEGAILNVFGSKLTGDVFAVGGQPKSGKLWHFNKSTNQWETLEIEDGPLLNWGAITSREDQSEFETWLVGSEGRILRKRSQNLANGTWEKIESPTNLDLWGVWAKDQNEAWAVGGNAADEESMEAILLKWNGNVWEKITLPTFDRSGVRALFKVFGVGKWVFAVGMKGVIIGAQRDAQGQVGTWQQFKISPIAGSIASTEDLISLWGNQEDQIMAVGGRSNGIVVRWDGEAWQSSLQVGVPGLNGVWMAESGEAFVVGGRGSILSYAVDSFEGKRWRTDTTLVLHSVWGNEIGLWGVGGSLDNTPPWEGIILDLE